MMILIYYYQLLSLSPVLVSIVIDVIIFAMSDSLCCFIHYYDIITYY